MTQKRNNLSIKKEPEKALKDQLREAEMKIIEMRAKLNENRSSTHDEISKLVEKNGFFCGVILDKPNLVKILELALNTGESVKIPFHLYDLNE